MKLKMLEMIEIKRVVNQRLADGLLNQNQVVRQATKFTRL